MIIAASVMILAVFFLLTMGLVMLASLQSAHSGNPNLCQPPLGLVVNQLIWIGIGLALMGVVSRVDYKRWRQIATRFAGAVSVFLVLGWILGMVPSIKGAGGRACLDHWGSFQPSILAGAALVMLMARWYENDADRPHLFFWIPFSVIMLWSYLILCGSGGTSALLLLLTGGVMMFLGGERVRDLLLYMFCAAGGLAWLIMDDALQMVRISATFMEPQVLVCRPLYTLAREAGGWCGVGLGHGYIVNWFLPDAGSEFMSAFIGEELGIIGLLMLNVLYIVIGVSGVYIGTKALNRFAALLAFGIVALMVLPVLLNLLMLTSPICFQFPLLPFVSVGGFHLCMSLIGVGVLVNIALTSGGKDCHETGMSAKACDAASPRSS